MIRTISDFEKIWQYESSSTEKMLSALTDESLSQAIDDSHRNIGRLAWHIVTTIPEMMNRTGLKLDDTYHHDDPLPASVEEIKKAYSILSKSLISEVKINWTDESLKTEDEMYGQVFKKGFTLLMLIQHQIHHRGQMTTLMRQAGLIVPGIYGPAKEEWSQMGMTPPEI